MKTIALILAFIFVFTFCPALVLADDICIENASFESELFLWTKSNYSDIYPYAGEKCLSVLPSPTEPGEYPLFITEYQKTVLLTRNNVYEISFYIRTDSILNSFTPSCKSFVSAEDKHVRLEVLNASLSWQKVSAVFLVDKTDYYTFSIETRLNTENTTFFVDEIAFSEIDFVPVGISLNGPRTVSVPDIGTSTYTYKPCVVDKENNSIEIHNGIITPEVPLPEGVTFNSDTGLLSVSSNARPDSSLLLICSVPGTVSQKTVSVPVKLTRNVIENGTFDDLPINIGWSPDQYNLQIDDYGFFAAVPTNYVSDGKYIGSLSPAHSMVLYAENLYVFRAKVRTESSYTARNMATQVLGPNDDNLIRIQIANICGNQWNEAAVAFRVPSDGVYSVCLDLHSPYCDTVHVDNVVIRPENHEPLSIYFDSPMHVTRPENEAITIPLSPLVVNQFFLPQSAAVSFSVEPENPHVYVSSGLLTVSPYAECMEYAIVAYLNDNTSVQARRTIIVSDKSVLDGSFESTEPGQAWMTAEPSDLSYVTTYKDIYPSEGGHLARLTMNGSVSMVMSDSVNYFRSGTSYIFEADMSMHAPDIETVVTVLVDDAFSDSFDDNLVIGQFTLSKTEKHICHLFTPSQAVTGRIMIAFNTYEEHDQQIIFMDAVKTSVAAVYASSVVISGSPFLDKNIIGNYRFSSNFNAVDASTYRWLISESPNSIFVPIPGEKDNVLSITKDMMNKYIKFEVTPVSPTGPVIGESVSSGMIFVGEPNSAAQTKPIAPQITPQVPSAPNSPEETTQAKSELHAMNITQYLSSEHKVLFYDLMNHWAANEISVLTASNIVQGRGNGLFEPEAPITRAEFSAILARAFQLAPIYYENTYSDVRNSDWYAGAVAVITKYGITQGTSAYTFSPNLPITREEMATMIMRAYKKAGGESGLKAVSYLDVSSMSPWAVSDILESGSLGLLHGMPDGNFAPKANATRAEAATIIYRMLNKLSGK
ncbi:MAG: S-layer homology domain-containing protein [Clostridia bacterium]|nr:S-layer homology domain-containing protein [Clostridia bacterium]